MSNDRTGRRGRFPSLAVNISAASWGFAEATFFFIVPDVLLSWFALRCLRTASWACLWAVVGALAGGLLMYSWSAHDAAAATQFLKRVPAIDQEMIQQVDAQIEDGGSKALFFGPLGGRPYKIYAVQAGVQDQSLASFLLVSVPARGIRFLLLVGLTGLGIHWILASRSLRTAKILHIVFWTSFYGWYFYIHSR